MDKPIVLPSEIAQQLAVYLRDTRLTWYIYDLGWEDYQVDLDKLAKAIQQFYDSLP